MAIGIQLLGLAAKIALDRVLGGRTDEALTLLNNWWSGEDSAARNQELAQAKDAITDAGKLQQVVAEAVAAQDKAVDKGQIEAVALSLSSGFKALPADLGADRSAVKMIADQILPGSAKTFVVWLDHTAFSGPRRYVHFNWDGESWRVRDFLGGKIFHPPGAKPTDKGMVAAVAAVTALEIWKASRGQIQSLKQYGLNFPITAQEEWQQVLALLTRGAEAW